MPYKTCTLYGGGRVATATRRAGEQESSGGGSISTKRKRIIRTLTSSLHDTGSPRAHRTAELQKESGEFRFSPAPSMPTSRQVGMRACHRFGIIVRTAVTKRLSRRSRAKAETRRIPILHPRPVPYALCETNPFFKKRMQDFCRTKLTSTPSGEPQAGHHRRRTPRTPQLPCGRLN